MGKKCTSKAKSPATQQPQPWDVPERIKGIVGLYRGHAEQFDQDDRSQETQMWAYGYWRRWPEFLARTLSWVTRSARSASDEYEYELHTQPQEQLTQTHEAATRYLMREAVRRKLDPSPLWEESRYCRELLRACYDRAVWGRERTVPPLQPLQLHLGSWPDVLAEQRYEIPSVLQSVITDGEGFFAHLIAVLEIDILAAKAQTAETLPEIPLEDLKRPAYARDHLWLEWTEAGAKRGEIRDRWRKMTPDERKPYAPADATIGKGKAGWSIVDKALRKAKSEAES